MDLNKIEENSATKLFTIDKVKEVIQTVKSWDDSKWFDWSGTHTTSIKQSIPIHSIVTCPDGYHRDMFDLYLLRPGFTEDDLILFALWLFRYGRGFENGRCFVRLDNDIDEDIAEYLFSVIFLSGHEFKHIMNHNTEYVALRIRASQSYPGFSIIAYTLNTIMDNYQTTADWQRNNLINLDRNICEIQTFMTQKKLPPTPLQEEQLRIRLFPDKT